MSISPQGAASRVQQAFAAPFHASSIPFVNVGGLGIHRITAKDAVAHVFEQLDSRVGGWVMTPNVDILRRWRKQKYFREQTRYVTLNIADGMPLVWASRLRGEGLPERITGADITAAIAAEAVERDRSLFLLGGAPDAARLAAAALLETHPRLNVAGTHFPPYGFEQREEEWHLMAEALRIAQPDIVFVGLGSPKQEVVISRLRHVLPFAWWFGVGVTFSFLGGQTKRAPRWMQSFGLEWLFRLSCEPKRLSRRYLLDDLPFAITLLSSSAGYGLLARCPKPTRFRQNRLT